MLKATTNSCAVAVFLLALAAGVHSQARQKLSKNELELAHQMLLQVKDAIEKNYYDPTRSTATTWMVGSRKLTRNLAMRRHSGWV